MGQLFKISSSKTLSKKAIVGFVTVTCLIGILLFMAIGGWTQRAAAAFPGANGKIAFVKLVTNTGGNEYYYPGYQYIYSMNADGSGQTQLTDGGDPAWSPDGSKIAFSNRRDYGGIWVMNADGSGQTQLAADGSDPAWSPDGSKIAFTQADQQNNFQIWVMNADGSGQTQLTRQPGAFNSAPAWSPDGTKIAFTGYGSPAIFVMNADGSGQTQLTHTNPARDPAWSPDGTKIAFTFSQNIHSTQIYVMNADGSSQRQLTNNTYNIYDGSPTWSPDGAKIAFNSNREGAGIYVMNTDGSGQAQLTNSYSWNSAPDWQTLPDTTPPTVTNVQPTGAISGNSITVSADYSDAETGVNTSSVVVTLDGSILSGCIVSLTHVSCPVSGLTQGPHTIGGWVADRAGNRTSIIGSFEVDTTPPTVSNIQPTGTINSTSTKVSADYSDAESGIKIASVLVTLDGKTMTGCTTTEAHVSCPASGLAPGQHTIGVSVSDEAGNSSGVHEGVFEVSQTASLYDLLSFLISI